MTVSKKQNTRNDGRNMEEKIVAAAEKLFLQEGYRMTSTTQIAREAGCNQALVHYYFRTKEKLFDAVLGDRIREALKGFFTMNTGEGSFEEKLTRMIEYHFEVVCRNSDMLLFLFNSLTRNPEILEEMVAEAGGAPAQTLNAFVEDMEAEIAAGRIRPVSIRNLLLNVLSLNAFPFIIMPVFSKVLNMSDAETETLLRERKKEVVDTILLSLRP